MNTSTSPSKSGIQYGILFGTIMILELVIGFVMKINPALNPAFGTSINVLNFLILPLTFIYLGCTQFKNTINAGFVSFGQCLKIGVTICVIAGLIYSLFSVVFNMIFPEYMAEMYQKMPQMMRKQNPSMKTEEIEMGINMIKKMSQPMISVPLGVLMFAFIGLIHSLLIGAFVKKDSNPFS